MTRPFISSSPWNTPIGAGAEFQQQTGTETDAMQKQPGTVTWIGENTLSIYQSKSTDPLATWTYDSHEPNATWQFGSSISGSFQTQTPSDLQFLTSDGFAVLESADGQHFFETWLGSKTSNGSYHTAYVVENTLDGTGTSAPGHHDGIRAGGTSLLAGLVTKEDLNTLNVDHAVAMSLPTSLLKASSDPSQQYVWPAASADAGSTSMYTGTIPMGALFAIPKDIDLSKAGLSTPEGMALARAFQTYGGYVSDTTDAKSVVLASLETGASQQQVNDLHTDMGAIRNLLQLVTNNSATSVGGGSATSTGDVSAASSSGSAISAGGGSSTAEGTTSALSSAGSVSSTATTATSPSPIGTSTSTSSSASTAAASNPTGTSTTGLASGTVGTTKNTTNSVGTAQPAAAGSTPSALPEVAKSSSTPAASSSTSTGSDTAVAGMANTPGTGSLSTAGSSSASGNSHSGEGSTTPAIPTPNSTGGPHEANIASTNPVTDTAIGAPLAPWTGNSPGNATDPAITNGTTRSGSTVTTQLAGGSSTSTAHPVAISSTPTTDGVTSATSTQNAATSGSSGSAVPPTANAASSDHPSASTANATGHSHNGAHHSLRLHSGGGHLTETAHSMAAVSPTNAIAPQAAAASGLVDSSAPPRTAKGSPYETFAASDKEKVAAMAVERKITDYEAVHLASTGWKAKIFDFFHHYW